MTRSTPPDERTAGAAARQAKRAERRAFARELARASPDEPRRVRRALCVTRARNAPSLDLRLPRVAQLTHPERDARGAFATLTSARAEAALLLAMPEPEALQRLSRAALAHFVGDVHEYGRPVTEVPGMLLAAVRALRALGARTDLSDAGRAEAYAALADLGFPLEGTHVWAAYGIGSPADLEALTDALAYELEAYLASIVQARAEQLVTRIAIRAEARTALERQPHDDDPDATPADAQRAAADLERAAHDPDPPPALLALTECVLTAAPPLTRARATHAA
ncbi:hypothetical protein GCM10025865_09210 [Paraoerskovia sediminicola]|uniref:Uncharacterized protein n=1 Tax=Paraoerskovia sediminicola TaxID=1138587 RepID=A0ABN6XA05_9CELL|nr:hypothetical protein [Paraoerskovia sediminicola]BDZ41622.1 hypothetical protein GCM10025865_09210 [Paraoerskovia sediminicola]